EERIGQRRGPPRLRRRSIMMQERERQCETPGIGALKAGASEHYVAPVLQEVSMYAMPQKLDSALVSIRGEHTGTPEFKKLKIVVARDQGSNVEFAGRVKTAIIFGQRLPQQPVCADHGRPVQRVAIACGVIQYQQMVADCVVAIDIPPCEQPPRVRNGCALLIKHVIT